MTDPASASTSDPSTSLQSAQEQWTLVSRSRRAKPCRSKTNPSAKSHGNTTMNSQIDYVPTPQDPDITLEKLQSDFATLKRRFADSKCARHFGELLGQRVELGNVDATVCVGIGSFSRGWAHRWRSLWQLVLFMWVCEYLERQRGRESRKGRDGEEETSKSSSDAKTNSKRRSKDNEEARKSRIKALAQDPTLTPLDITFLFTLNVTPLAAHTGAEPHITSSAFLFAPFVDWALLLPTFISTRDPALYVGCQVVDDYQPYARALGEGEEAERVAEDCRGIGGAFLREREGVAVRVAGLGEGEAALDGLFVYLRKEGKGGKEKSMDRDVEKETAGEDG